jgi:hypothetical protein
MSDEQEQRRDPADGGPVPDETREHSPFDDGDDANRVSRNHPDDGPRSGDAWVFDRAEPVPGADDPTAVTPRAPRVDATSVMPAVDEAGWAAGEAPWAGRAEVRPPRPGEHEYTSTDWAAEPPAEPRGTWWMPILVGIVVLVLLALLGWGVWLILQAQDDGDTPATTTSPTAVAPATTPPTAQPTTAPPTTRPATTEPAESEVTIPALQGLSQGEAQQALSRRGLSSRLRFINSTKAPPGTVIDSDPAEGQKVPPDTVVTLVIAAQPTTSPTTATATPTAAN